MHQGVGRIRITHPPLRQIVVAVPLSPSGRDWIKAGRAWRRGLRAAYVADFNADAELRLDGGLHGEEFIYLNSTDIPFHYYGKAAMVPSVAHEHFGQYNYKWMLYGDDDTIWFLDSVVNIVKGCADSWKGGREAWADGGDCGGVHDIQ